jgi:hypothetical protein
MRKNSVGGQVKLPTVELPFLLLLQLMSSLLLVMLTLPQLELLQ